METFNACSFSRFAYYWIELGFIDVWWGGGGLYRVDRRLTNLKKEAGQWPEQP